LPFDQVLKWNVRPSALILTSKIVQLQNMIYSLFKLPEIPLLLLFCKLLKSPQKSLDFKNCLSSSS
jgi:hypothetical protein